MSTMTCSLAHNVLHARLDRETFRLTRSEILVRSGRSARTLVNDGSLRVMLIALSAGNEIPEHHMDGPVLLQGVYGSVRVRVGEEVRILEAGDLLSLAAGRPHVVDSPSGGVFLLVAEEGRA